MRPKVKNVENGYGRLLSKVLKVESTTLRLKDLQSIIRTLAEWEVKRVLKSEIRRRLLPQNVLDFPIQHLDLSIRAQKCLERSNKYAKVSDLLNIHKTLKINELLKLRGFGKGCLKELADKLYQLEILEVSEKD